MRALHLATTQTPVSMGVKWELYVNMLVERVDLSGGVWVAINDEANLPEIKPGDEVYVVPPSVQAAQPGNLCVFRTNDGDYVLRRMRRTTGTKFEAVASNGDYATLNSVSDGLETLGVVTRHMRQLA